MSLSDYLRMLLLGEICCSDEATTSEIGRRPCAPLHSGGRFCSSRDDSNSALPNIGPARPDGRQISSQICVGHRVTIFQVSEFRVCILYMLCNPSLG